MQAVNWPLYIAGTDGPFIGSRATSRAFSINGTPLGPRRLEERLVSVGIVSFTASDMLNLLFQDFGSRPMLRY